MKEIITIRGTYWTDNHDRVCIDVFTPGVGHETVCLDYLMKDSISEGTSVEMEITVHKPERRIRNDYQR